MPQKTHTMHGRDHCSGGADPIPCLDWLTGPGGAPVDYGAYLLSLGPIGYWRLGETGTPWEDTSGNNHDMVVPGYASGGTALTPDVTGGLPVASDDGAVRFNYTGAVSAGGQYLHAAASPSGFFQVATVTYTAFVKLDGAGTNRGQIVGSQAWAVSGGGYRYGAALQVMYPSLYARFSLGGDGPGGGIGFERYAQSPGPLLDDTWYHVAGTYDGTNIKLYLNGTLVATVADAYGGTHGTTDGVDIGYSTGNFEHFYLPGTVDEAAVWDRALTAGELAGLGNAAEETGATEGQVLTADGDGGSYWSYLTEPSLTDGAVTTPKLAAEAVTPEKIEPGTDGYTLQTVAGETVWAATPSPDPLLDTAAWMPLTTVTGGVPELVWDANDDLIPTLTPI